jgi:MoaA/NifB/PqqE/SkfB family radical SAM enzyme
MIDTSKINPCNKVFCVAPWLSLNINQNGDIQTCCITSNNVLGNSLNEDIKDIWNNEKMREFRRCMVEQIPVESCRPCYEKEIVGQKSLRQIFNESLFHNGDHFIYDTNDDYSVNQFGFIHWDVKFGNKCNFKCRTCCAGSSSSIEFEEHGRISGLNDFSKINFHRIKPYVETVNHLYFSGGEPLIIEEHYKMIAMLMKLGKHKRDDFYLNYNTNFSTLTYKKYHIFDIWDKFQHVYVNISVDGSEKRGELIRNGFNWDKFVSHVKLFNEKFKGREETHQLRFDCTVQALNIFNVVDLHQTLYNTGLMENIDNFYLNFLNGPRELSVWILDKKTKEKAKNNIRNHIDNFLIPNKAVDTVRSFESLIKYIDLYQDQNLIPEFIKRMNYLDVKRNENTLKTFPELFEIWSMYLKKKNPSLM